MASDEAASDSLDSSSALKTQVDKIRISLAESEKKLVATLPTIQPDLEEFHSTAPDADGVDTIPLKIIRRKNDGSGSRPLILLFHGGGFFSGSPEMLTRPAREFAEEFNAVVVLASYRFCPEHPFPKPIMDGWHLAHWILENTFGADPASGFVVGGFSAGGQLSAVICERAKGRPLRYPITGCFLCISPMLHDDIVPEKYHHLWKSRHENVTKTAGQDSDFIKFWLDVFQPDPHSPWFSPFNAPDLSGMPPTYIQVGGLDIFRDDCVIYAKALEDNGVPVRIDVYQKMAHGAYTVWAQGEGDHNPPELKSKTMNGLRWLLDSSSSE